MKRKEVPVDDIEDLIGSVRILKHNKYYRYAALVNEFDSQWTETLQQVLLTYTNSILHDYFTSKKQLSGRDIPLLKKCIDDYSKQFTSDDNTLYIHFRLGDATCQSTPRAWLNVFNQGNIFVRVNDIIRNNPNINKVVVVTAMHFDPRNRDYEYNKIKEAHNKLLLRTSIQNISRITGLPITLLDNKELSDVELTDYHFSYLCTSKHVVLDDIGCWTGLGSLLRDIRCNYINELDNIPKVEHAGKIIGDYQIMHNGLKIVKDCYDKEVTTDVLKKYKHFEPDQEVWFHRALETIQDNGTMIELGSYWGYYSMWFNHSIRNATNILVDSAANHLDVGKKNFEINNMSGTFENMFVGADNEANNTSVDDIIKRNNLDNVDIVHADIQHAEYNMLIGSRNAIASKKIKWFFISTHNAGLNELCNKYLVKNGYYILESIRYPKKPSIDGLIVAKLK